VTVSELDRKDALLSLPKSEKPSRRRSPKSKSPRDRGEAKDQRQGDLLGRVMEAIARGMGTPAFLIILTVFVGAWISWNSLAPEAWRFDSAALGFIALTLALSLQASYAAPMLLLAQNRQDDRDRVQIEQDRQRAERNTADLEYLTREVVALRMLVNELASKDFIRAEIRALLEDIEELGDVDDIVEPGAGSANGSAATGRAATAPGTRPSPRDD
jgi:uncharacterized membrane protein